MRVPGAGSRRARLCLAAALLALAPRATGDARAPDAASLLRDVRARLDASDPVRAATLLEPLVGGELADHALYLRARALREAGDAEGALAATDRALQSDPPSELRARIHRERFALAVAREDLLPAYREQRSAWENSRDPERAAELALELARAFETAGLPGDALTAYATVWRRWPLTRAAGPAWERGRYLAAAVGAPPTDPEALADRADRLREAFRCEPALELYDELVAAPPAEPKLALRIAVGRAHCLFQRRRYPEAETAFGALAAAKTEDLELRLMAARSRARRGDGDGAVADLEKLRRRGDAGLRARVDFLLAVLADDRDPARSRKLLERLEKQRAEPALAATARWRLAWEDLRANRYAEAERRLQALSKGPDTDIEVQRARYWHAQTRSASNAEEGRAILRDLADAVPLSYYGLLAADELAIEPPISREVLGERAGNPESRTLSRARTLASGAFPDLARDELSSRLYEGVSGREERIAIAKLLHELGDHHASVRVLVDGFGDTLDRGVDPAWRDLWELAWPRAFEDVVDDAAREFDADPALVWAVMREESTYRPEVESPVGARGLMQMIEPTAARISRTLGLDPFTADRLFEPRVNVRFGTYYLTQLLAEFRGRQPLAIAAYNAGPEAVVQWIGKDGELSADSFVESVRYDETRRYVRRVLRSYRVYRLLYGAQSPEPAAQPRLGARR
jgi:soluble lytic murein transglycosylase